MFDNGPSYCRRGSGVKVHTSLLAAFTLTLTSACALANHVSGYNVTCGEQSLSAVRSATGASYVTIDGTHHPAEYARDQNESGEPIQLFTFFDGTVKKRLIILDFLTVTADNSKIGYLGATLGTSEADMMSPRCGAPQPFVT